MSFINKINIYIVDRNFLVHRGIKQNFLYSNLFYYIDSGIIYLYFFENSKLFNETVKIVKNNNNKTKANNSNNILLEDQKEDYKNKINRLEKYIKELESKINDKDTIINELKTKNLFLNKAIKDLENNSNINNIKELKNEIQLFKSYCNFSNDEKLIKIKFISSKQDIDFSIITKNNEKFSKLEIPLYEKYQSYLDSENYFLVNGKKVNRNRTLKENNIKNGDVITLLINNYDE